jgi:outer membrane lipoprotein-sorting protein
MSTMAILVALVSQDQGGGDAGMVVPEKELPAITQIGAAAAAKFKGYKAAYSMVVSDAKTDTSTSSSGTIHLKKKSEMQIVLEDPGQNGDSATAHRVIIVPGKKVTTLWPESKMGEEEDVSKSKDLSFWKILATPWAGLSKDYTIKIVAVSGRYAHEKTQFTNMGGDTRKDFKDPAAGKKPSFDPWTCHRFELTPKNAAHAAQVKKITVSVDMNLFCVTRIEFDYKGDGTKTGFIAISEIEFDAKVDDKLFEAGKEFTVKKKEEPKKEEKK